MPKWVKPDFVKPLIKQALVDGKLADTNIPVATIRKTDQLIGVIEFQTSTNNPTDQTSACSITSDGNIQCTAPTNGDKLLVTWQKSKAY